MNENSFYSAYLISQSVPPKTAYRLLAFAGLEEAGSDKNGINIHRFRTLVFNLVFGIWFLYQTVHHLSVAPGCIAVSTPVGIKTYTDCMTVYANQIIPMITPNNLILLGASSGVYATLKITENKQATVPEPSPAIPPAQNS